MKDKKLAKIVLILTVVIAIFVMQHLYFNFQGTKISQLIKKGDAASVQIVKTYETSEKSDVIKKVTLSDKQREMLISLFEDTEFKKIISKTVPYRDKERYLITAEASEHTAFRLESYGGEFLIIDFSSGDSPGKHWKLRIKNDEWKDKLEEIITLSN